MGHISILGMSSAVIAVLVGGVDAVSALAGPEVSSAAPVYRLHYRFVLESAEITDHKRALTQEKLERLPGWIELWAQVGRS